jgi:EAL domain-containing protein (putative c-di-GMP-specific phosphodiesterase class I)
MGKDRHELMRCADIALYSAKHTQKDFCVYSLDIDTYSETDLTLLGDLRTAINDEDFVIWYQPKVHLITNKVESVECLIRWQHPIRGIIMPDLFIPIAEQSNMIKFLTQLVIRSATNGYSQLQEAGFDLDISINISPNDVNDPAMMTTIIKNIVRVDMDPSKFILEVTETALLHDTDAAIQVLVALQSLGIKLSIDDFGVGHSSLLYLKNFPISEIKFDKSFITDIEISKEGRSIVKSNIELAHSLNAVTVAEGVESKEVQDLLKEIGCDYAQGYYIAKPMPIDKFIEWLNNREEEQKNG